MTRPIVARTTAVSRHEWTLAEVVRLPSAYRLEVLDGILYLTRPAAWPYPALRGNLLDVLRPWIRTRRLGRVLHGSSGIHLDERNFLMPDVLYLTPEQVPAWGDRPGSATMAAEILSPSELRASREERETLFQQLRVEEVWYVDYPPHRLEIRRLAGTGYETAAAFENGDTVTSTVFPGLEFPLSALWEDLGE